MLETLYGIFTNQRTLMTILTLFCIFSLIDSLNLQFANSHLDSFPLGARWDHLKPLSVKAAWQRKSHVGVDTIDAYIAAQ